MTDSRPGQSFRGHVPSRPLLRSQGTRHGSSLFGKHLRLVNQGYLYCLLYLLLLGSPLRILDQFRPSLYT